VSTEVLATGLKGLREKKGLTRRRAPAAASKARSTIFVVHGHDAARTSEVTAFLQRVTKLRVVIMDKKAQLRRTLIEKFEDNAARAAYAVVLLTADDEGRPVGSKQWRRRARQNVMFELGFFYGAIGRSRVAVLYQHGVELPSDLKGVGWVPLDAKGSWKPKLAKELKHAKIDVDLKPAGVSP
jgi:predicted nucleotide-binding protein